MWLCAVKITALILITYTYMLFFLFSLTMGAALEIGISEVRH